MEGLLTDETAVVTGGASGNGRAMGLLFAEHGADVVVADLREQPRGGGAPTHERIEAETDRSARFVETDVADPDDLRAAVDAAGEFGGISVMVNNAGITHSDDFLETTEEEWYRMMDVNAKGTFFGTQAAARRMVENGVEGSIVNMSSFMGIRSRPDGVRYCASKGAIRQMTYAMAGALGEFGIRVNVLHPGLTETQMSMGDLAFDEDPGADWVERTPSGRVAQPLDVARAALFLASDLASYVNGTSLPVDGGRHSSS
jgi:NAD(P)-dependent dehydrogenase (short-subunit alcohol dehydrogenase family)